MVLSPSELPFNGGQLPVELDGDGRLKVGMPSPKVVAETVAGDYVCTDEYHSIFASGAVAIPRCGNISIRVKETGGNYDAYYKVLIGPTVAECVDVLIAETVIVKSPAAATCEVFKDGTVYMDIQAKNKTVGQEAKIRGTITIG